MSAPYDFSGDSTRRGLRFLNDQTPKGGSGMRLDNLGMLLIFAGIALWAGSRVIARA